MSRSSVLSLYRNLLRASSSFPDYNLRSYSARRVRDGFRDGRSASGEVAAAGVLKARESLALIIRQATVSNLFPGGRNVMENLPSKH